MDKFYALTLFISKMFWTNYHSHSHYCDGKMSPEDQLTAAISQRVKIFGFSSHCPVPFESAWSMPDEKLHSYLKETAALKLKYQEQLEVYTSLEVDYVPGEKSRVSQTLQNVNLDYVLGSVHFVGSFENGAPWEIDSSTQTFRKGIEEIYGGNVKKAIGDYYQLISEMVAETAPDIVGHLDKIKIHNSNAFFFNEENKWYKNEVLKTLEAVKACEKVIEVNTRGIYKKKVKQPYPGIMILKEILKMDIPICLNSDSHHPSEITAEFGNTASLLKSLGFKKLRIFHKTNWIDVGFSEHGIIL